MSLSIVILNENEDSLRAWFSSFELLKKVLVVNTRVAFREQLSSIDTILMLGKFAHEKYGGGARLGESQILTAEEFEKFNWVVTVPPLPVHIETQYQGNEMVTKKLAYDQEQSIEGRYYSIFDIIFESIDSFNKVVNSKKISKLGINLDYIGVNADYPREKALGVRKAYLKHYECSNWPR